MVEIADTHDHDSLQTWLQETNQPRPACVALAYRAVTRRMLQYFNPSNNFSKFPTFRALLVSAVAGGVPDSQLRESGHGKALQVAAYAALTAAAASYAYSASYAAYAAADEAYDMPADAPYTDDIAADAAYAAADAANYADEVNVTSPLTKSVLAELGGF
jgi:hypothetical protein